MVQSRSTPARQHRPTIRRKAFWGLVVLVVVIIAVLELTNTTHLFHKKTFVPAPTNNANTKGEGAPAATTPGSTYKNPSAGNQTTNQGAPSNTDNSTGNASGPLEPITGNLVSSHHVTVNTTLQSVCNTSAGASCTISFTKDGVTKALAAQTTDEGGSTYWAWQPKDIGLDAGSWTIAAKATLGSQTQTSTDALQLEVSP